MRASLLVAALLSLAPAIALAQTDTSQQLDPSATCPYQTGDQIQTCLAQVESDESTRPGGPCTSSDWSCICNKQQGLIDCYKPCPGTQDREAVDYNNVSSDSDAVVYKAMADLLSLRLSCRTIAPDKTACGTQQQEAMLRTLAVH